MNPVGLTTVGKSVRILACVVFLVGVLVAASGCGGAPSLTGTVTKGGKPYPMVVINFKSKDSGKTRSTNTDADGKYTWTDATPGEVQISVGSNDVLKKYQDFATSGFKTTIGKSGATSYDVVIP
jgi:hypothetical protein